MYSTTKEHKMPTVDALDFAHNRISPQVRSNAPPDESSAVSWAAIFAGALGAAAASMALLALGTGLGLSAISPWAQKGVQASTFGVASIVWVIVTQLWASALGGYLAGRLRARWASAHIDEVYFRDTAHGLLAWAFASLTTVAILLAAASSALGTATQATATLATGAAVAANAAARAADGTGRRDYLIDSLFRKDSSAAPTTEVSTSDASRMPVAEVARIFVDGASAGSMPVQDLRYVGQLVSQRTGLTPDAAEKRVSDAFVALQSSMNNAKTRLTEAADKARKLGIESSLWLFIALLAGAFIASYTATIGGRQRDAQAS
jgi:hypothetical protein